MLRFSIEPVTELEEVRHLLADCGLPFTDIIPGMSLHFFGHRADLELIGIVGLELCGSAALLRSLAIQPQQRNNGLGRSLVSFAESQAKTLGVETLYLLTTTAKNYFSRLDYTLASRLEAPHAIKTTAEFSDLCPASSTFMQKFL